MVWDTEKFQLTQLYILKNENIVPLPRHQHPIKLLQFLKTHFTLLHFFFRGCAVLEGPRTSDGWLARRKASSYITQKDANKHPCLWVGLEPVFPLSERAVSPYERMEETGPWPTGSFARKDLKFWIDGHLPLYHLHADRSRTRFLTRAASYEPGWVRNALLTSKVRRSARNRGRSVARQWMACP